MLALGVVAVTGVSIVAINNTYFRECNDNALARWPPYVDVSTEGSNLCEHTSSGPCTSYKPGWGEVSGHCDHGQMDGDWKAGAVGAPFWDGKYCHGKPCGEFHVYEDQHVSTFVYDTGGATGRWSVWRRDGGAWTKEEGRMSPKGKQGTWTYSSGIGEILRQGAYLDGKMVGQWKYACGNGNWKLVEDPVGQSRTVAILGPDEKRLEDAERDDLCPRAPKKPSPTAEMPTLPPPPTATTTPTTSSSILPPTTATATATTTSAAKGCADDDSPCKCPWLKGWSYRKTIIVTNGGAMVKDLQVGFAVNTSALVEARKMLASGGDIRVTLADAQRTLVPYVIESGINTGQTSIWVRLKKVPGGSSKLYLYYGNPDVSSTQKTDVSKSDVWVQGVVNDPSFEGSDKWAKGNNSCPPGGTVNWSYPSATWASDGERGAELRAKHDNTNTNGCTENLSQDLALPAGDYVFRVDAMLVSASGLHGNPSGQQCSLGVCKDAPCNDSLGGGFSTISNNPRQAFMNIETTVPASGKMTLTFISGAPGGGPANCNVVIDNIRLRKLVKPEPMAAADSDETARTSCP